MEILSDDAKNLVESYLNTYQTKLIAEREKADLINNLIKSSLEDKHLQKLFNTFKQGGYDFLSTVFPRTDIDTHKEYVDNYALEENIPPAIRLELGIPNCNPGGHENVQGNSYGFYLISRNNQNNSSISHLPRRVKGLFSWKYNQILLEPEEVEQTLKAIVRSKNYKFELPNPTDIQTGLEKAIGESINYITRHR